MFEFGALGLVSIISLSSELEIMYHFFCWIPYSLKNSLTKFENFLLNGSTGWEPAHSVRRILIKVHYWRRFKFGAPKFVLVISPSSELRITLSFFFFFLVSLFFKEHSIKISKIFSVGSTGWHPVQSIHRVSLYRALILGVLEPKSYMAGAHNLHIDLGQYFGSILSLGLGSLQPTMNPYGFLMVKQTEN